MSSARRRSCAVCQASRQVVDYKQIQSQPLNGRLFQQLITRTPGASPRQFADFAENPAAAGVRSFVHYTVNGLPWSGNNYLIDGIANNEPLNAFINITPPLEAIQEFKVQSSNPSAEFGVFGGAVVNLSIRSGTNQFSGSLFEYYRDDALNARNFFAATKAPFESNQFGGTLGGPILRNRMFFFGDYQGLRQDQGRTFVFTVPTPELRRGDLSALGSRIFDPLTGRAARWRQQLRSGAERSGFRHRQEQRAGNAERQHRRASVDSVVDLAYVGTRGTNIFVSRNINVLLPGPGSLNERRPYFSLVPNITAINQRSGDAESWYDALQLKIDKRFSQGLQALVSYTFSRTEDTAFILHPSFEKRVKATGKTVDIPHNLVVSWAYELPIGPGKRFLSGGPVVVQKLLEGWAVNGITSYQSGEPINIRLASSQLNTGTDNWANVTCSTINMPKQVSQWFDTSCFRAPPLYEFGNYEIGDVRGPEFFNTDFSVFKRTGVGGTRSIELRLEVFNLFNRAHFQTPGGTKLERSVRQRGIWPHQPDTVSLARNPTRRPVLVLTVSPRGRVNRQRHSFAPRYAHTRSRSAKTPPAVTAGPAPGPWTTRGFWSYRLVMNRTTLSVRLMFAKGCDRSSATRPTVARSVAASSTPTYRSTRASARAAS